jgi:hypothetical protein
MKVEVTKDELTLLNLMRKHGPYATFTVEKRPTAEQPDGQLSRFVVETSTLLKDLLVITTEV